MISAGCIKSDAALQQIDPPSSRHENTAMASARTGVYMCVCVVSPFRNLLICLLNHSVREEAIKIIQSSHSANYG